MARKNTCARQAGFTLVELLVTLAIAALLGGLAAPAFQRQIAAWSVTAAANQAVAGLHLARRTALATGRATTLCLSQNLATCSLNGREWMVFANGVAGSASRREAGEPLLQRWPLPRGIRVTGTRGYASFLPQTSAATTLTFHFCHRDYPALQAQVIVSQTGRPRISRPNPTSTAAPSRCP